MTEGTSVSQSAERVSRKDSSFVLSRYWLLFWPTLVSTGVYLWYRIGAHRGPRPPASEAADKDQVTLLTEITRLSTYVADNLHQAPPFVESTVQMGLVVLVTWLWFYTFRAAAQLKKIAEGTSATTAPKLPWYLRLRSATAEGEFIPIPRVLGTISTLPALLFVFSMYGAYQPAVFVMALVAVFVAAEHYGGLREQGEQLTDQLKQLRQTRAKLNETQEGLESIQRTTETLLNFEGLARFKADMYRKYAGAEIDISAVVRFYDIDQEWWECGKKSAPVWTTYLERFSKDEKAVEARAEKEKVEKEKAEREKAEREKAEREKAEREKAEREKLDREKLDREKLDREKLDREEPEREKPERETAEREKAEKEEAEKERAEKEKAEKEKAEKEKAEKEKAEKEKVEKEKAEKETLIGALTNPEYLASTTFVSDLPLPLSGEWNRRRKENELFRDLLGMTWQLVVLEQARTVRARRNEADSVGPLEAKPIAAYVGSPSSWMHVVDSTVFQVIWRNKREESSVRELTVDINPDLRHMVCRWAHDDIQRYAGRASRAEEYIVAVLRFAAFQLEGESEIVEDQVLAEEHELSDVLGKLGMSEWLEDAHELNVFNFLGDSRIDCGRKLCVDVFRKFLLQRWDDLSVSISPGAKPDVFRFKHLTLETL